MKTRARSHNIHDVVIIGAGPAGVGLAVLLKKIGIDDVVILEADTMVGATFRKWPRKMRFITPSFNGNDFGAYDLNSIAPETSPGHLFRKEHLSGAEYAAYLEAVVEHFQLRVRTSSLVLRVARDQKGFRITPKGKRTIQSRSIVWAGGEFSFPAEGDFSGSELCLHNTRVMSWEQFGQPDQYTVIGGYESGIDAAYHLTRLGHTVTVIDRAAPWDEEHTDPSRTLSPYTFERLTEAIATGRLTLVPHTRIESVIRNKTTWEVRATDGKSWSSNTLPILANGFDIRKSPIIQNLFDRDPNSGHIALTENDESTLVPGAYLVGPSLRQQDLIFCFIYKFRGRFPVVARAIAKQLGRSITLPQEYTRAALTVDDLSCCGGGCGC